MVAPYSLQNKYIRCGHSCLHFLLIQGVHLSPFIFSRVLQAEALTEGEAFLVESLQLGYILLHAVYLHRAFGANAHHLALVLQTLHQRKLLVVDAHTMAECHAQARIFLYMKCGIFMS